MDGKDKVVGTYHGSDLGIIQFTVSIGVRISGTFYLFADRHLIAIVDPDTVAGSYIAFVLVYRKIRAAISYGFTLGVLGDIFELLDHLHGLGIAYGKSASGDFCPGIALLLRDKVEFIAIDGTELRGTSQLMTRILGLEDTIVPFPIMGEEIDGAVLMAVPVLVYDKCTLTVIHIRRTQDGRL